MPPAPVMAKSAVCHSGRFVAKTATRSPGLTPSSTRAMEEAGDAAEEFGGGDWVPSGVSAEELGARIRGANLRRSGSVSQGGAVAHGRWG